MARQRKKEPAPPNPEYRLGPGVRMRAASTPTVRPVADPYGLPHHMDSGRGFCRYASDEQMERLNQLIEERVDTERNLALLREWAAPLVRQADLTFKAERPSALEVTATVTWLEREKARRANE